MADWGNAPPEVLVEIFSYLSVKDRIKAGSTCKFWRHCLLIRTLWKDVRLHVNVPTDSWQLSSKELSPFMSGVAEITDDVTIHFDSESTDSFINAFEFVENLSGGNLTSFRFVPDCLTTIKCHNCFNVLRRIDNGATRKHTGRRRTNRTPVWQRNCQSCSRNWRPAIKSARQTMKNTLDQCEQLGNLHLGCIPVLTHAKGIYCALAQIRPELLRSLYVASISSRMQNSPIDLPDAISKAVEACVNLVDVSLDFHNVSADLLNYLCVESRARIETITLHVHPMPIRSLPEDAHTKNWLKLRRFSPNCNVHVYFIRCPEIMGSEQNISKVLSPAMPLTSFKTFFCNEIINLRVLSSLSSVYGRSLEKLWIIDTLVLGPPPPCRTAFFDCVLPHSPIHPDPLVMIAWRCRRLKEMVLIGHLYNELDIVAISRLRGSSLERLEFLESMLIDEPDLNLINSQPPIEGSVSQALHRRWAPIKDEEVPLGLQPSATPAERQLYLLNSLLQNTL